MKFLTKEENSAVLESLHLSAEDIKKIEKVAVHGDKFHADDAAAVALIYLAKKELGLIDAKDIIPTSWVIQNVIRVKRQDIPTVTFEYSDNVFVADMMNGLYDHHDMLVVRYPEDEHLSIEGDELMSQYVKRQACPYAAAGKVWHAVGHLFGLNDRSVQSVDKNLFLGLDLNDNFGGMVLENDVKIVNPISAHIANLNYHDITNEYEQMKQFGLAVYFMVNIISSNIYSAKNAQETYEKYGIEKLENSCDNGVVVVDKYVPANLFDVNKVAFVVSPNNKPGWWQVSSVDSSVDPIKMRNDLSEDIRAEMDTWDINHDDQIFFHKSRFLAVLPNKELAEKIAHESYNANM